MTLSNVCVLSRSLSDRLVSNVTLDFVALAMNSLQSHVLVICSFVGATAILQVAHLKKELGVSTQHILRIKGVTTTSGLDVFAANAKVREQDNTIAALRDEVRPCMRLRTSLPFVSFVGRWCT